MALIRYTTHGSDAIAAVRDAVASAKAGDPLRPVQIVVPDHLTGLTVRRSLATGLGDGRPGIAAADCMTLHKFAEHLATLDRQPATGPIVAAAVREALADDPGAFGEVAAHPATAVAVERASGELRHADEATLTRLVELGSSLVSEVIRVHRQVWDRLAPTWYDVPALLRAATAAAQDAELGNLIIYLPQTSRPLEIQLLQALSQHGSTQVIIGLTGEDRADAVPRTIAAALANTDTVVDPMHPGDAGISPANARQQPGADRIIHASDADDEVRAVVRETVAALSEHPAHRLAILYGNRRPYARILHEQLTAAGVRFNGPGARPVSERAFGRFLLGLLQIHRDDYPRGPVLRVLSELPTTDANGANIPTASWERLSRNCGIVGGEDWTNRIDTVIAELHARDQTIQEGTPSGTPNHVARRIEQAIALRDNVAHIRERMEAATAAASWTEAVGILEGLVERLVPDERLRMLPPEEAYARTIVSSTLASLAVLDDVDTPVSAAVLEDVLVTELEAASMRVGRFGEGVYVGPVESAIGLDLDTVIVCGLSEDVYPGRLGEDPLLPEQIRAASGGALPTVRERLAGKHRALLAAFQCADTAIATFARGDLRQQTGRIPSRWLLPSIRTLAGEHSITATQFVDVAALEDAASYAAALAASDHLAVDQEWRLRAGLSHTAYDDEVLTAARALTAARSSPVGGRYDGLIGRDAARPSLFDEGELIAPTRLEEFAGCPHTYFVQRLLRVRPIEDPEAIVEFGALDRGTLIHGCFEALISEAAAAGQLPGFGQPWSDEQHERMQAILHESASRVVASGRAGHPKLWQQTLDELSVLLDAWLTADSKWRAEQGLAVIGSEVTFGARDQPPLELRLPTGTLRLRGSADKVDRRADGTLVVTDIKSGSSNTYIKISDTNPLLDGTRLQLPAYAYAVRERFGDVDTPVEATYWCLSDGKRIKLDINETVARSYEEALTVLVAAIEAGHFPQRPPEQDDFAWVQCPYCNPDGLGYTDQRRRWHELRMTEELRDLVTLLEPAVAASLSEDDGSEGS